MKIEVPAISVIIPMYNAEKYIGECLDSILAQTFQDFEVIVVDDASTDNSREIVKSYLPKFQRGGVERLRLICSEKNSGGRPGVPRNRAIQSARGKYLLFVDSDDGLTKTALAELFQAAEYFQADVVHCVRYFEAQGDIKISSGENLKVTAYPSVDKPLIFSDDLVERVKFFCDGKMLTTPWNYLFSRELIVNNKLEFPNIIQGEDGIFDFYVLCKAKTFVIIPNVVHIIRVHSNSWSHKNAESIEEFIWHWYGPNFKAIELFDNFMNEFEVLKNNSELKYRVFEFYTSLNAGNRLFPLYAQIPAWRLDDLIRRELADVDKETAVTAFFFSRMAFMQMQIIQAQQIINQQQNEIAELQRQLANKPNSAAQV